jgi:hypothetical protein
MLPFDDDDEVVMRRKIIQEKFEDPEWLSAGIVIFFPPLLWSNYH